MNCPFRKTISIIEQSAVPHVAVGGFAVVMHGVSRFTPDFNVCIDWQHPDFPMLLRSLEQAGYLYNKEEIQRQLDGMPSTEERWFIVFDHPEHSPFRLDLMVRDPLPLAELLSESILYSLGEGLDVRVCSLEHLLQIKEAAARGQDRIDYVNLQIAHALATDTPLPPHEVDEAYIENLREFVTLSPAVRLQWLESMLNQYCSIIGGG